MNEELTKDIVRTKIDESFEFGWNREPEKSQNININKLLKNASKSEKGGIGYPEFLITNKNYPNLVIVVECKAHIKSHESSDRNKYKDYAVDGVLWYSKYLSKNFDVIAIAVSGEKLEKIKVTNFLVLRNGEPSEISKQFLNPFILVTSLLKFLVQTISLTMFSFVYIDSNILAAAVTFASNEKSKLPIFLMSEFIILKNSFLAKLFSVLVISEFNKEPYRSLTFLWLASYLLCFNPSICASNCKFGAVG